MNADLSNRDYSALAQQIKTWGHELGFQQIGITDTDLAEAEGRLDRWLQDEFQGEMGYMARHGHKRSRPAELVPGTLRVISVRLDFLAPGDHPMEVLDDPELGFVSRYALGRDYHKVLRNRLQRLAKWIETDFSPFGYRVFTDSAPVLEKPLAEKAGLGWLGKHSNLVNRQAGSWFFLGELYTDLPLPIDEPQKNHCGSCQKCLYDCPTQAIVQPYRVDARRCISYLTMELHGAIPEELRPLMGNRIYGCDDCLQACPWNRFALPSSETDFLPRNGLDAPRLVDLFSWTEAQFLTRLEGSPIRRIGHKRWLRNIAVALGNAPSSQELRTALEARRSDGSELVREHVVWALEQDTIT